MAYGMSYEDYWHGDLEAYYFYRKKHEREMAQRNQEMYMQGLYNYAAFQAVMASFGYALGGGKGAKPDGYLENPIPVTKLEEEIDKQRKAEKTKRWFKAQK